MGRHKYGPKRRQAIVQDYLNWHHSGYSDGRTAEDIARQYRISKQTLYSWVRAHEAERRERAVLARAEGQSRSIVDGWDSEGVRSLTEVGRALRDMNIQLADLSDQLRVLPSALAIALQAAGFDPSTDRPD